jgi:hypothetical protein
VKIGRVRWKSAGESDAWRIGVGLEKLDRDLYDPEKCYDDLAAVGAKWVRIQSGWCRTEKVKGVYDFTWLDIVQFEKGATMVALETHGQRSKLDWWLKAGEAISPTFVYFTWRTGQVQLLQAFFHLPIQAQPRSARSESKRLPLK